MKNKLVLFLFIIFFIPFTSSAIKQPLIVCVTAAFSDDAPACQGVPINFTDASSYDTTTTTIINWDWSFGDGFTSTSQNPSHPYSAGGSYNVKLIVTTASGCKDSITQTVNIQGMPVANGGNDTVSCANNPNITLLGTILNAGGGIWSGSGNFSSNISFNPTYSPLPSAVANGTDTVLWITTSNVFCPADTDQVIITFSPSPTINTGPDFSVCKDTTSIPVCATITVASGGKWQTMGSGTFANDTSLCTQYIPSSADTTAGVVTLFLSSTGNGNCNSTTDSVTITFTSIQHSAITSNDNSCASNPLSLGVNTTTGAGMWSSSGSGTFVPNNTALNGAYIPSAADDLAGNVTLFFVSTNNNGCRATHDTLAVTLIPSPTANYSSVVTCPTFPVTFTDLSTSTGTILNWNWNFGDGSPANTSPSPSHIYNTGGPYNVQLVVTSNNGCVDTVSKIVTVYNKPNAGYDANGICLVDGTQFTDTSTVGGSTIASWNWNFGDGATSIIKNPIHNYAASGNYNATLIVHSAQGCIDTVTHPISVLSGPGAGFISDDVLADIGQNIHFIDQSTSTAVSWFWDFGDSQTDSTSTSQNASHVYYTSGYYNVCLTVTDVNGCTDTICKQEIVSLPPGVPSGFTPNGDGENDVFNVYGGPFKTLDFKVYNNWGELVFESDKQSKGWDGKRKDIDQPMGVYVYTIVAVTEDGEEHKLSGDVTLLR